MDGRVILPPGMLLEPVNIPRPARLPAEPSEEALDRAEKRLQQTQTSNRHTVRPDVKKRDLRRHLRQLKTFLDQDDLEEKARYDALVNIHLIERELKIGGLAMRVAQRYGAAGLEFG